MIQGHQCTAWLALVQGAFEKALVQFVSDQSIIESNITLLIIILEIYMIYMGGYTVGITAAEHRHF